MKIKASLIGNSVASNEKLAFNLQSKGHFGEKFSGKIQYMLSEALFLVERHKMDVYFGNKKLTYGELYKKAHKIDKKISTAYPVYKDLRSKGYIVKTGLKF